MRVNSMHLALFMGSCRVLVQEPGQELHARNNTFSTQFLIWAEMHDFHKCSQSLLLLTLRPLQHFARVCVILYTRALIKLCTICVTLLAQAMLQWPCRFALTVVSHPGQLSRRSNSVPSSPSLISAIPE